MLNSTKEEISKHIADHDVVLYMKGNAKIPMCGFSATVVQILAKLNVKPFCINVLERDDIRNAIKEYSNWPTIPQLYIKKEFIGGCDIVTEMYENGALENLLKKHGIISVTI